MRVVQCLLILIVLSLASFCEAALVLRTAAQESSEPKFLTISKPGGAAVGGICVDIFRQIEKLNPEIRFVGDQVWMPRARIDAYAKAGNIDVICGLQKIPRNTVLYDFLGTQLFSVDYLLAVRADDNITIESWDDIRRLGDDGIILALRGFGIVDILQGVGGLTVDAGGTSSASNLRKLLMGRGRFYCHRSPGIKQAIRSAGMQDQIRLIAKPVHSEKFFMGIRKNLPAEQVKKINSALILLEQSGELKKIFDKYKE
nr:transporter substrate-binding domain-containing protein [uncultured Undibacterium sp.]